MSDLPRWSRDGATPEELRLIAAGRSDRPSEASRMRMLRRAGIGVAVVATATATTSAAAAGSGAAGSGVAIAAKGGISVLTKIVVGTLVLGAAAGGAWRLTRTSDSAPSTITVTSTSTSTSTSNSAQISPGALVVPPLSSASSTVEPEPAPPEASASVAVETIAAVKPPIAVHPASTASSTLSDEVAALERARKALASGAPGVALQELARYEKRFPSGALSSEKTVLRVQALLANGEGARAIAVADQFAAKHPDSPYARRVLELVAAHRKK